MTRSGATLSRAKRAWKSCRVASSPNETNLSTSRDAGSSRRMRAHSVVTSAVSFEALLNEPKTIAPGSVRGRLGTGGAYAGGR